eukprot:m.339796 g.339796  ORF g.339796 m.339796 type:complete len:181 (-) comp16543_c0_seq2:297-839(-)
MSSGSPAGERRRGGGGGGRGGRGGGRSGGGRGHGGGRGDGGSSGHHSMPKPDQFLGTASLLSSIDKKLLCVLRDGRKLIGYLRSIDQFANLVLQHTIERIHVDNCYGDIERGIYLIRSENVVLLGEIDPTRPNPLKEVSAEEILQLQHERNDLRQQQERLRNKLLMDRGLQPETLFDDIY